MKDSIGATTENHPELNRNKTDSSQIAYIKPNAGEKRVRTGSFFSNYHEANINQNISENGQEMTNIGSIKEIALFSRLANFKEFSV